MNLELLSETLAVCRLSADTELPSWFGGTFHSTFYSATRTPEELSLVCEAERIPETIQAEKDWRCLRVSGTLAFQLTGILASLTTPLAQAKISIFAISTFDTDYLLVKHHALDEAIRVLEAEGHLIKRAVAT